MESIEFYPWANIYVANYIYICSVCVFVLKFSSKSMVGNRFAWISNRKTEILFTEIEIKCVVQFLKSE